MDEPKFWVGDKLKWPNGGDGKRDVIVRHGPMRVEYMRAIERNWGQPVYLCELPDKTSVLIGEKALRSYWVACLGEHRKDREGGWEKLQCSSPTGHDGCCHD